MGITDFYNLYILNDICNLSTSPFAAGENNIVSIKT